MYVICEDQSLEQPEFRRQYSTQTGNALLFPLRSCDKTASEAVEPVAVRDDSRKARPNRSGEGPIAVKIALEPNAPCMDSMSKREIDLGISFDSTPSSHTRPAARESPSLLSFRWTA